MRTATLAVFCALLSTFAARSQRPPTGAPPNFASPGSVPPSNVPPSNGPPAVETTWHALSNATVITEPGVTLERATVVFRDGLIRSVASDAPPPIGARVWDCTGLTIYAAFVEPHLRVASPAADATSPTEHWNPNVRATHDALARDLDGHRTKELRELGFASAAIAPGDGIFRGVGGVVALHDLREGESRTILRRAPYHTIGFRPSASGDVYPRSLMGAIALIRQTLLDATRSDRHTSLDGLGAADPSAATPLWFDCRDELESLRAAKLAAEFGRRAVLLGNGLEFRRLDAIVDTGLPIVVPLGFPAAPEVDTIDARESVTLRELLTWEHAPSNPRRLLDRGVTIALTTDKLTPRSKFAARLRRAMRFGLEHDRALAALTTVPARLLGVDHLVGRIAPGLRADLLVVDGRLGETDDDGEGPEFRAIWIGGRHHELHAAPVFDLTGTWSAALELGGAQVDRIDFTDATTASIFAGESSVKAQRVRTRGRQLDLSFAAEQLGGTGVVMLHGVTSANRIYGVGADATGRRFGWSARRVGPLAAKPDPAPDAAPDARTEKRADPAENFNFAVRLPLPFGAYGLTAEPEVGALSIEGITLWTGGDAGIVEDAVLQVDVHGKVRYAGKRSDAPPFAARVLDLRGFHVTPGLIDCHSHTGISRGINEATQAVTAEVRIADVVDPDDIGWYRELAGGLTIANQLHGSANPIGGQNCVVKLRWGVTHPDRMVFEAAPPGIKFALGENVKQANRGDTYTTRYPQTRMGVEAILRERFATARDYARARSSTTPPPRDLELDALAEILAGERLVHCHSYRQDEILMLCRIAEDFDFEIGTFQHGLECYKVADAIRGVSRGASVFTDWWAYKYEVVDAIPHNAAILHENGVLVSFNSDSNELARRMNTEAAKAVKYGGVDPHTALQFVTLNPAKQLGIDDRVGSLEAGKDADFAVWSGSPLSSMSRCLSTWIDGRCYWSDALDLELRTAARLERERLIQLVLTSAEADREGNIGGTADGSGHRDGDSYDNSPGECACDYVEAR